MEYKGFEAVIGLEVHCELKTETKIFCSCPTAFGAEPNTQCCPVCMGLPGALPVLNRKVVEYAIMAGVATGCDIARHTKQDRKNYFYPDLPKAYQISQYDIPLCTGGHIDIEIEGGASKRIGITRIHIEEDAGKLIHDDTGTLIDYNRCGIPLIEIVSEPDIRSAEEAKAYVRKLRSVILYTGVCDCKMNEGSMRVDINLSVRRVGDEKFGTRTEMKNLNSINYIGRAIEYEFHRQVDAIIGGEEIVQETRRYDPDTGKTVSMRRKENASDYRYFPDPDLPPIEIPQSLIDELSAAIPTLPDERKRKYTADFGITPYDAEIITQTRETADYFESAAKLTRYPKLLANLFIGEVVSKNAADTFDSDLPAEYLAEIADLAGDGEVNNNTAKALISASAGEKLSPSKIVEQDGLAQLRDREAIRAFVCEAFATQQKAVADYKKGKTAALKSIVGKVMALTRGRADPIIVAEEVESEAGKL